MGKAKAPVHVAEFEGGLDQGIVGRRGWVAGLWLEMRPRQWVKNLFVLVPLLFSRNLFAPAAVGQALATFILFCLVSSSVYLLNDIQDRSQDRFHPTKRFRPLAAGELSLGVALGAMVTLLLVTLAGGMLLGTSLMLVLLSYWLINLFYSTWLKSRVLLDVFAQQFSF